MESIQLDQPATLVTVYETAQNKNAILCIGVQVRWYLRTTTDVWARNSRNIVPVLVAYGGVVQKGHSLLWVIVFLLSLVRIVSTYEGRFTYGTSVVCHMFRWGISKQSHCFFFLSCHFRNLGWRYSGCLGRQTGCSEGLCSKLYEMTKKKQLGNVNVYTVLYSNEDEHLLITWHGKLL